LQRIEEVTSEFPASFHTDNVTETLVSIGVYFESMKYWGALTNTRRLKVTNSEYCASSTKDEFPISKPVEVPNIWNPLSLLSGYVAFL
jgi:hypothetical protein